MEAGGAARILAPTALVRRSPEGIAWLVLGVAMVLSAVLVLWMSRHNTFFNDEVVIFERLGGGLDLETLLTPHNGHLIAVTNLVYWSVLSVVGPDYSVFRLLGEGVVLVCVVLMYLLVKRRVGPVLALAPAIVVLFLGSSWETLLFPVSALTAVLALAFGLASLLLVERQNRVGDVGASIFLALALFTHSTGLAFVVGLAAWVMLGPSRRRRAWVYLLPLAAYAAWWVWALRFDESQIDLLNILIVPGYVAESLAAVSAAVTGLSADLIASPDRIVFAPGWGRPIALIAGVALVVRMVRGEVPRILWALLAVVIAYWASLGLAVEAGRSAAASRYLFPGAVMVFLVAAAALQGRRISHTATIAVFAVAAAGVATNVRQLDSGEELFRWYAPNARAQLSALELAHACVAPDFHPRSQPELEDVVPEQLPVTAGPYLAAVERFGSFAMPADEIVTQEPGVREGADRVLAAATGIELGPSGNRTPSAECGRIAPAGSGGRNVPGP